MTFRATREQHGTTATGVTAALMKSSGATTAFAALSYGNQRQHVLSVTGATTPETRERRIAKVVEALTS